MMRLVVIGWVACSTPASPLTAGPRRAPRRPPPPRRRRPRPSSSHASPRRPRPSHAAARHARRRATRARAASPARRDVLVSTFGKTDPLVGAALQAIVDRGDVIRTIADEAPRPMSAAAPAPIETDPGIVARLVERSQASLAALKRDIQATSGSARLDFIRADLQERRRIEFDPQSLQAIMAGMEATWWLNDQLQAWLGETNAADTLVQSVPRNVTSEMGLALLDVADLIRPHPEVVAFLQRAVDDDFLDALLALPGGGEAREAITGFLATYGMRGVGEIDITRPRWSERPSALLPILLGNLKNFETGAARRRFEQGERAARAEEQDLLVRVRALPDGERKAEQTQRMIDRLRTLARAAPGARHRRGDLGGRLRARVRAVRQEGAAGVGGRGG